jgi:hypothetical protein
MARFTSKTAKLALLGIFLAVVPCTWVLAGGGNKPIATDSFGVAIKGYDTVAYFTEGRAVKGNKEFEFMWHDAKWRFASAAHRDMFSATPGRYVPQFGGFCSMGIARDLTVAADPEVWKVVDGKLYLSYSKSSRDRFHKNLATNLKKAEENWAKMSD